MCCLRTRRISAGSSFLNCALTVSPFQTQGWLSDRKRSWLIVTSEIVETLTSEAVSIEAEVNEQQQAVFSERYPSA